MDVILRKSTYHLSLSKCVFFINIITENRDKFVKRKKK